MKLLSTKLDNCGSEIWDVKIPYDLTMKLSEEAIMASTVNPRLVIDLPRLFIPIAYRDGHFVVRWTREQREQLRLYAIMVCGALWGKTADNFDDLGTFLAY